MRKFFITLLLLAPVTASLRLARPAFGQEDPFGVDELADGGVALGTTDMRESVAGIINIVLSFLGILTTIIILIGGFKWMTSQGNSEKVDEAKKLIGAGVVGLVIVFAAYIISRFVIEQMIEATGAGGE